jgi:hypothetical protein
MGASASQAAPVTLCAGTHTNRAETNMAKLASITPNRMDLRLAGDSGQFVNLQFHNENDHLDVIVNRSEIPLLIEQLKKLETTTEQAQ